MPSRQDRCSPRLTATKYGLAGLLALVAVLLVADLVTLRLPGTVTVAGIAVPTLACLPLLFASVVLLDVALRLRAGQALRVRESAQGTVAVATLVASGYSLYDLTVGHPGVYWAGALALGLTGLLVVTVLVAAGVGGVRQTVSRVDG